MCVNAGRSVVLSRPAFFAGIAAAAAPIYTQAPWSPYSAPVRLPDPPAKMSTGNARAVEIARNSAFITSNFGALQTLAKTIGDAELRSNVLELMSDPAPRYAGRWFPGMAGRELLDALVREGFVAAGTPLSGIFPALGYVQPFWSAPGSSDGSHHAYPGGLTIHERFNAEAGTQLAHTYDRVYFADRKTVDTDITIAAAIYHDVMKTAVFQWNDDGTIFPEAQIGATGAHHVLSGAEAIVRGRSARLVIAILSAHAAPSLGDEAKVVTWCRAAAMIAKVDPVDYGLLKKTPGGFALAPAYVPMEAFVNHLSDHDFVLSVHAFHEVERNLARAARAGGAWQRNRILSQTSAIALYEILATRGEAAFDAVVERSG